MQGRLHELIVHGWHHHPCPQQCVGLRNLILKSRPYQDDYIENLIRVVGPSLESIENQSSGPDGWKLKCNDIKQVYKYCTNLSHVSLSIDGEDEGASAAYAELLCSLGSQVKFADLKGKQRGGPHKGSLCQE